MGDAMGNKERHVEIETQESHRSTWLIVLLVLGVAFGLWYMMRD